jgi:hypothetical protein
VLEALFDLLKPLHRAKVDWSEGTMADYSRLPLNKLFINPREGIFKPSYKQQQEVIFNKRGASY